MKSHALKIGGLLAIVALLAMMVAPALATENLAASNSELNFQAWIDVFDGGVINETMGFHSFAGNDQYLSRIRVYLRNDSAAEAGTIRGVVFNVTDTGGLDPEDAEAPVEYSNMTLDISTVTSAGFQEFTFGNDFLLASGTIYCIGLEASIAATTPIEWGRTAAGGLWSDGQGDRTWTTSTLGLIYYLYTDDTEGGSGTPYVPPGGADLTSWDTIISSFTSFVVPLIVVLLPAMLLMFLTRRTDKWLLIIGITIGAGLGYYFNLVPLWLVFLVVIGLIGMAYQSVRGGGT